MLSGTWFLPISLQRQKQIKPSGYSAALKFKVCHCGSLHLKLPEQGTVRASRSSWLSVQLCTDQSILNLFPCQSSTFPPFSHQSCPSFARQQEWLCKSEPCIWPHLPGWHPSDWSTDSHTHSYNFSIQLQWRYCGESEIQYKADADHNWISTGSIILSHLVASSFFILVILWCSSPFPSFPCRSISMPPVPVFSQKEASFLTTVTKHVFPSSPLSFPASCS